MASSMLTSERRWTSTRKSGMTVLGKVPKPINLPSQKLENHGLDPNVEIVPKGAHTWGTRPLPASSNAWGSSTLSSPRADGSVGSSIHGNGRPLSGGNGTRPSTGSSERSSEPSAISWGPSSRPSSASGIVPTSNALVAANRPRSAETRPNSSQLSRFAESSADVIARAAAGNPDKLAAEATRSNFTLSSGDFPTLGSEKNDEPKSQGYGNLTPTSHGNFNSWSADNSSLTGEDSPIRSENWHKDNHNAQPLLDPNVPIQQFASWHGTPGHPPNVVWYGGHESGGLCRSFGPRDSYHPDPYYPYAPAGALPNTQAFSRAEPIPGGVHFKRNNAYGHIPPESYSAHSQLGIPVRPGVYPGPVIYEGFHGSPHKRFDNSSGQDVPTMGMPVQYGVHNQHLPDNARLQPWRFHVHPDGAGSVMTNQHVISDKANETQGQYKVLLKQHGSSEEEHNVPVWPTAQTGKVPAFSIPEVDLVNCYKQEQPIDVVHSQDANDLSDHSNKSSVGTLKSTGHNVMKKINTVSAPIRDQRNILKKNASLMEKIEGLNSKTRVVDVNYEGENFPLKEKMESSQNSKNMGTSQLNTSTKVIIRESVIELKPAPHQSDGLYVAPDMSNYLEDGGHSHSYGQKRVPNIKGGVDNHYGKLKFGSYGSDERNDTPGQDSLEKINQEVSENQDPHLISKSVSEPSSLEFADDDVQHAKLKELARQRAIELQRKELERTAEQKAKALAKLDELNRRTLANSKQISRRSQPPSIDILDKLDTTSGKDTNSSSVINETPHEVSSFDSLAKCQVDDDGITKIRDPGSPIQASLSAGKQSCPLDQELTVEINTRRTTSDLQDCGVSRRKQAGYRRRRNITDDRNQSERKSNSDSSGNTENIGNINSENSTSQSGNKNNGETKSKNNLSETQPTPSTPVEKGSKKYDGDHNETITPVKLVELVPVPEKNSDEIMGGLDSIQVTKMTSERASNNWKPHSHRKPARNLQSDKANAKYQGSDTVVWAPVRPVNKNGSSEVHKSSTSEIKILPESKNGQDTHNGAKARRAEMERYVPKPIAKELSLQGDPQHSSPSFAPTLNTTNKPGPASSNAVTSVVSKTVVTSTNAEDTKQNRQGKIRASWRQRNSVESPAQEQSAIEGSPSMESSKCGEKATDLEPSKPSDDLHAEGDEAVMNSLSNVKNHGVNRQRRQQYKEHRVDRLPDKREMHSLGPAESGERNHTRNENLSAGSGQMRSHWQPKSQVQPQQYQYGYKGSGQRADEKSLPSEAIEKNLNDDGSTGQTNKNKVDAKYHSSYSEIKAATNDRATKQCLKDENESMDRDFSAVTEAASANASSYQEHPGMHRHRQNHSHFAGSQKTRPTGGSTNAERQFEYQKTGYAGGDTPEAHGVSSGARHGIQGRNQSRRGGHFYGARRGPTVRASGVYDIGG